MHTEHGHVAVISRRAHWRGCAMLDGLASLRPGKSPAAQRRRLQDQEIKAAQAIASCSPRWLWRSERACPWLPLVPDGY